MKCLEKIDWSGCRRPVRENASNVLYNRAEVLLYSPHGVMRRSRQAGRNVTDGNTLEDRSPEHGIRHAAQTALLITEMGEENQETRVRCDCE